MLLTSVGERGHADVFAAVLTKPARQSQLLRTLASVLGIHDTGQRRAPRHGTTERRASRALAESNGPLVLVAEDTSVNQLVARRMLEKLGCRVDVVEQRTRGGGGSGDDPVRGGVHGRPDARNGRLRGDRRDPPARS